MFQGMSEIYSDLINQDYLSPQTLIISLCWEHLQCSVTAFFIYLINCYYLEL